MVGQRYLPKPRRNVTTHPDRVNRILPTPAAVRSHTGVLRPTRNQFETRDPCGARSYGDAGRQERTGRGASPRDEEVCTEAW